MEVLNLLTTNQFLQNSSKDLQKSSRMSPKSSKIPQKSNSPFLSVSAAGLLGPYLVSAKLSIVGKDVLARLDIGLVILPGLPRVRHENSRKGNEEAQEGEEQKRQRHL